MVPHTAQRDLGPRNPAPGSLASRLTRLRDARTASSLALAAGILLAGVVLRLHFSAFLDPFEDGYQNWWISANLLTTGQYWDRFSMMTQGNWLPMYHFFGAGTLAITGWHNFEALKLANIALSTVTAVLLFFTGRKQSVLVGFAAMAFFNFNFIDIVISGWSTAESLGTLLVFLGYIALFHSDSLGPKSRWIAAASFALATMTRYEAWLVVTLLLAYALIHKRAYPSRRDILKATLPSVAFMVGYFAYALQWGFLPAIVVNQTSTDLRYQIAVGTQRGPLEILSVWWTGYVWYFPLVLALGGAYALWHLRKEVTSWIIVSLWAFIVAFTVFRFGNPSFRYVMITVPFLSLLAAIALERFVRRVLSRGLPRIARRQLAIPATVTLSALIVVIAMVPPPATFWDSGFVASRYMEPLVKAGEFVATLPLPPGKILLSESPIAAYYSGYPADRILGSRWLPDNRSAALTFLKENVAFLVYMGVPYYTLRELFPELQNGSNTSDFELLYDAGDIQIGTHAIYVYEVLP